MNFTKFLRRCFPEHLRAVAFVRKTKLVTVLWLFCLLRRILLQRDYIFLFKKFQTKREQINPLVMIQIFT